MPLKSLNGGFLKCWVSPTTMGFPTKNDHFGVFWGYHHLRKHPYFAERKWRNILMFFEHDENQ